MIVGTYLIIDGDPENFAKVLNESLKNIQDRGYNVDVKYSTAGTPTTPHYSALIVMIKDK